MELTQLLPVIFPSQVSLPYTLPSQMLLLLPRIELNASLLSKLFQALSNLAAVKNWTRAQRAMNTVVMMELKMWNLAMKAIVRTGLSDG